VAAGVVRATEWWAMALMAAMVALVTMGVFYRYVLGASLSWYDEFASYLLVWLSFYGAVVGAWSHRHISFDTLVKQLGRHGRRAMAVVSEAISAVFYLVLIVYGTAMLGTIGAETAVSMPAVRMAWIYSVLPISGTLMLIAAVARITLVLGGGRLPEAAAPETPTVVASE
jgi:TRAP-type C4-dicarboxylate transport system permease small subunit